MLDNKVSIAFVIRDADGHLIMVAGKPVIPCSVKFIELLVVWWGLFEVYNLRAMHIHLEGDSIYTISLIDSL